MHTHDELTSAKTYIHGLHMYAPGQKRLSDVTLPLSAIIAAVREALAKGRYFPPGSEPEELGDGAVLECLGNYRYRVHERFEVGVNRYSPLVCHRYVFLRSAVVRYLKHYRALLKFDRVNIQWWS